MKELLAHFASRYIAGETIDDALRAVEELNKAGLMATVDNLGENVTERAHTERAVEEYLSLLASIDSNKLDATVSLKLTHMGLDLSEALALENTGQIVKRAGELNNFVRIDMEGSEYTELTVGTASKLHVKYSNVGVAIQSYLRRSEADVERLIREGVSVRLVKGAYKETARLAFEDKAEVDENFLNLMKRLLTDGERTAIATHDEKLIDEALGFVEDKKISRESFEFQMLFGIKRKLQKRLAEEGFQVRVYVPYGPEWLPYIMRRMTERKENLWFVLKNVFER